jgi:hypothetical protein
MKTIKFKQWECDIKYLHYYNDRTAIQLIDHNDGEIVAMATTNIPEVDLANDEIIIKNYSENETMDKVLMEAGIIGPALRSIQTGFVIVPIHKLLINPHMS